MTTVSGRLLDFVEDPSHVAQVQVRAREVRPHGDGVMLDHPVDVEWDPGSGTVTFDAAAGTAGVIMWHAVGRSHASGSLPIVVPDTLTATLADCVRLVGLADDATRSELERLAADALTAVSSARDAVREAGEALATAQESIEVVEGHAEATAADRVATGEDRAQTGRDVEAAAQWADKSADSATLSITAAAAFEGHSPQQVIDAADRVGTAEQVGEWAAEAQAAAGRVGSVAQIEGWVGDAQEAREGAEGAEAAAEGHATEAAAAAREAQSAATNLPATIASELDTRVPPKVAAELGVQVPPAVADALAGDRAVADAAAAAVSTAATGAGLEPQRTFEVDQSDRAEWSQITETGERLPLGYTADGRLDDLARQVWREDVTHTYTTPSSEYLYAAATEQGHLLWGVRHDGTFIAPGMTGQAPPEHGDLYVHRDGTVRKSAADMAQITTWGSSTPDLMTDALAQAFADTPATVTKQAKGGEWIEHHAARIGAVPALIDPVEIPASGDVAVNVRNFPESMDYNYAMRSYSGSLAGIYGTLSANREQFTFTRATAGSAVTLTEPTEFLPDVGPETRDHVIILGPGKNNLTQSVTGEADVIAYTDKIFDWLTPQAPRCIVLAHHNNTGWSAGSVTKGRIRRVNEHYRRRFGPLFFDLLGLITSDEIWDRTGITPTPEDLTEQALGNLAPSLGRDTLHLNETANLAVAQAIRDHVDDLGWY